MASGIIDGTGSPMQFSSGDNLWRSFQSKIAEFANKPTNGWMAGNAVIKTPVVNRPNWTDVKLALELDRSLKTVNCN